MGAMNSHRRIGARLVAAMLACACLGMSGAALAQYAEDPGVALSRHLRALDDNPRNVEALIGAGEAAVAVGDPQAAVTFFGRAEELRPGDGRIKAGLGSAFVHLGQPREALDFFDQAVRLGVPEYSLGKERGLAWDLLGDPRRAQRDYRLVLQRGEDDELRQRLALSLAISGDRQLALDAIDPQVRRQDRAAWRIRTFILALSGDTLGATQAAAGVMSADQAEAMRPFFAALPTLTPAQRAMAVHFGEIPTSGGTQIAQGFGSNAPSLPLVADETGRLEPRRAPPAAPPSNEPRRRPDAAGSASPSEANRPGPAVPPPSRQSSPAAVRPPTPAPEITPTPARQPLLATLEERAGPPAPTTAPQLAATLPLRTPLISTPVSSSSASVPSALPPAPIPGISTIDLAPSASIAAASEESRVLDAPPAEPTQLDLAGLAATLVELRDETASAARSTAAPAPPEKKPPAEKNAAPARKAPPPIPAEPSRHWVQIAGGANKASLPREFKRLQEKAPKLLGGRTAWTTPLRATNRLLVGPFKTDAEAQAFVNQLSRSELTGFSWTSEAGQKIEKLASE